ncbi:NupC/NupG family nucleoside CNT transporter [Ornithinicoccus halotolerans]|uniref:NupC/NupG family nucleoside CNT transporter n=1 Tax=Ornithinicoccus halotolerans TaxID=1748220 RepID=UPI001E41612F|nr:NupC/NupG family nucleoside CNT transporter [Ornithinicoccus halotolerans]
MLDVIWGLGGMALVLAVAVLFSADRRRIRLRTVSIALGVQMLLGFLVLYVPWGQQVLGGLSRGVQAIIDSSAEGIAFLFGPVLPEEGSVFAFQVLPVIVFFASLTGILYHLGALQHVVRWVGGGLARALGTTRPESMNAAANIFVGQTEAPLVVRPYVPRMSQSELFAVMVGGLSTVAGSVLVGYSLLGARLEYLIAASFMAAPGALLMAKIIVPAGSLEPAPAAAGAATTAGTAPAPSQPSGTSGAPDTREDAETARDGEEEVDPEQERARNVIDAAARGASDGLRLALNVGAMLLAFISLIALGNLVLGWIGGWFGYGDVTVQQLLGYVFSPVMTAIGVPWSEAIPAGSFLGQKVVLNEFVAFSDFAPQADQFSQKSQAVITFALTGFANLGSMAILLGGLGGIAPSRRGDIAQLGLRAVLAGTLANLMSAAIAGILIG